MATKNKPMAAKYAWKSESNPECTALQTNECRNKDNVAVDMQTSFAWSAQDDASCITLN